MNRISINRQLMCVRVWGGGRGGDQTYFSVYKYGSLESAWDAAVEFERTLPPKYRLGRKKPRIEAYCNSQTNIVGVNPYSERHTPFAGYRACWMQEINGERKPKSRNFSFSSYGNQALKKACECRKAMVLKYMMPGCIDGL